MLQYKNAIIIIIITTIILPVTVGALGSVTKRLGEWIKKIDISLAIGLLQKTTILGTARILRKVLDY